VPLAGFSAGCIYTVDPTINALLPQLIIGKPLLRRLSLVAYNQPEDIVASAFKNYEPIITEGTDNKYVRYKAIALVLGRSQRIGVIYMEIPATSFETEESQYITHLKALAQTFNDCLNLN
jgi:hypothetical protein